MIGAVCWSLGAEPRSLLCSLDFNCQVRWRSVLVQLGNGSRGLEFSGKMEPPVTGVLQPVAQPAWLRGELVLPEGAKCEELRMKVQHPISEIAS